jgi:pyridoxal phosphate enzyme (YggS family)
MSNQTPAATGSDEEIAQRLATVKRRIEAAAQRAGREPGDVTLLGASKVQAPERMAAAVEAGLVCLGENYVQEAREKQPELEQRLDPEAAARVRWHMIGPLQRNKARDAVRLFDVIETLDRESLAKELDKRAAAIGGRIDAFVQINLSGEPQKAGISEEGLPALLKACAKLEHLRVIGLMTIPAPSPDPAGNRAVFAHLRDLRDRLRSQPHGEDLRELSMGMSRDFETAIEEGATFVRVGTDLFGPRPVKE